MADFTHPSLVWGPRSGNPLEFRDETYPQKTRGIGLLYGENCVILASTVFDWSTRVTDRRTDGQTDGIAITYTRYSYAAVARKNATFHRVSTQTYWISNIFMVVPPIEQNIAFHSPVGATIKWHPLLNNYPTKNNNDLNLTLTHT